MLKKIMGILLAAILTVSLLPLSALAAESGGLIVHQSADQAEYGSEDNIVVTLSVENTHRDGITLADIKLLNEIPAGYALKAGSSDEKSIPILAEGEKAVLTSVFRPVQLPRTGDKGIGVPLLLGSIALLGLLFLFSGKKGRYMNFFKSMMCLLLAISMTATLLPLNAAAASVTVPFSTTVKVENKEIKLNSYVTYSEIVPVTSAVIALADDNGTAAVTANGKAISTATAGTSVVFSGVPGEGYEFDYWQVIDGGIDIESVRTNASITVTMPATALTMKAHFKAIVPSEYGIIVENDGHGTAKAQVESADVTSAAPGTRVKLVTTPSDGYQFKEWQAIHGISGVSKMTNTFTMPSNEVKVKAIFERVYTIEVEAQGQGTASASREKSIAGNWINLTATPEDGYQLDHWEVERGGVTVGEDNRFRVGTEDIKIKAVFEEIPAPEVETATVTIHVTYKGENVNGDNIRFSGNNMEATAVTDENGLAVFTDIPTGYPYWAGSDGALMYAGGINFDVIKGNTEQQFELAVTFMGE